MLIVRFQTELSINTHLVVSGIRRDVVSTHTIVSDVHQGVVNTHAIVSDIHRTIVQGQEGAGGKNLPVSATCTLLFTAPTLTSPRFKPGQPSRPLIPVDS